MRQLALAVALSACAGTAALAADLPQPAPYPKAPVAYAPPPYNWSGFYIGGNLGAGWRNISLTDLDGGTWSNTSSTQFVGGGQVGANYEFLGGAVIGVEADFDWLPNTNNTSAGTVLGVPVSVAINNRWLTTVTGRLGYAWDRVLVYGKGGGAWVGASNPSIAIGTLGAFSPGTSSTNTGWTAGFGVEWAFAGTWSVRAEYDYVGLNNQTFVVPGAVFPVLAGDVISTSNRNVQMFTVGLNYKFGPW